MANDNADIAIAALERLAIGKENCGKALPAEQARQIAREALMSMGRSWPLHPRTLARKAAMAAEGSRLG